MKSASKKDTPVIVFDFGGVLLDWSPYYLYDGMLGNDRAAVNRFLKEVDFAAWNLEQDRGLPVAQATAELCARFPQYEELIRAYEVRYPETIRGAIQPVVELLYSLDDAGYTLYGLSNFSGEKFDMIRSQYPFLERLEDMVISGKVGLVKPDRAIFEELLRRVGHPAQECVFIDDHAPNVAAALALGIRAIQFRSAEQLKVELMELGISVGME